ncbi:uncharacterized protein LOC123703003 [Colias croceus]|uniref:uncharacterized protein LOC123703003 n=1 Tax=Colias crocea TaxID=72248 RepID=UPI001E280666|nr:uncharacterized protein LOC123703003 [Colias croceus]
MTSYVNTRSSIKGRLTKFKNYINNLFNSDHISSQEMDELALRLDRFRALFTQFDDVQTRIEIENPTSMEAEIDARDEIEQDFISLIASAQKLLDKNNCELASVKSENQAHCGHQSNEINFRLPLINIGNFDGSYFKWLEFRDTFESLIHNNERIKSIHKFHYLNSYLEGEAAQVISNLEVTDCNYIVAWRLLCERYNNKRQLIFNHLNSLFNLQPIGRESAKSLRYLVDHVSKNLRALNTLGQPTDHWDTLIIHMVSAKLDNNTNLKWEEFKNTSFNDDKMPSLFDFNKFLKGRADVLESVQRNKLDKSFNNNNSKQEPFVSHKRSDKPVNMKTFTISAAPVASSFPSASCVFCNGGHRIYDCSSFRSLSVEDRIAGAARLKLCLNWRLLRL